MMKKEESKYQRKIPSFSSTLLDEIYRSIDDGEKNSGESKFYREPAQAKKQVKNRAFKDDETAYLRRACLIEKWMEKKIFEKVDVHRRRELHRKSPDSDHDRDVLFFSSTSISSDSSSGGLSSSDTDSMFAGRLLPPSCFAPARPKPIRTAAAGRTEKPDRKYHYSSATETETPKSRTSSLKKMKQPNSPGARLAGFLNSLFTAKTKNSSAIEKKPTAGDESTCSSGSSFARSCLSKYSASSREKMGNGVRRTVRFCPESIGFDEEVGSGLMALSIPTAWKIGRLPTEEKDGKEAAGEPLRKVNTKELSRNYRDFGEDEEDDDDVSSCASSDLFELDHLEMIGQRRFSQELPVYETTRVEKNRAIAKGLLMQ